MDQPNPEFRKTVTNRRHEQPAVLTPVQSRQGVVSGRIRWVLAISVTCVVVAFIVIYAIYA